MKQKKTITLTSKALSHFRKILNKKKNSIGIRIGIKEAGCSGKSYTIDFAYKLQKNDKVIEINGIQVIVGNESFNYLQGTHLDCIKKGLNMHITFQNPNAVNECGCGESFQINDILKLST